MLPNNLINIHILGRKIVNIHLNNQKSSLVKELDYDTSNSERCLSLLISGIRKGEKRFYSFFITVIGGKHAERHK